MNTSHAKFQSDIFFHLEMNPISVWSMTLFFKLHTWIFLVHVWKKMVALYSERSLGTFLRQNWFINMYLLLRIPDWKFSPFRPNTDLIFPENVVKWQNDCYYRISGLQYPIEHVSHGFHITSTSWPLMTRRWPWPLFTMTLLLLTFCYSYNKKRLAKFGQLDSQVCCW